MKNLFIALFVVLLSQFGVFSKSTFASGSLTVTANTPTLVVCELDEPFNLGARYLPNGNVYWTNDFFTPIDGFSSSIPVPGGEFTLLPPVNLNTFGPFQVIEFDPGIGAGIYPVEYTYTDPVTGCSGSAIMNIEVRPAEWQQTTSNAIASNGTGDKGFDVFTDDEYVYATGSFIRETTFEDAFGNSITINSNKFDLPTFYSVCHNSCGELQWVIYDQGIAGTNSTSEGFGINKESNHIFIGLNYNIATDLITVYPGGGSSITPSANGALGTSNIGHLAVISVDGPNSPNFGRVLGMGDLLEDHVGTALDVQENGANFITVYVSGESDSNSNNLSNAFASRLEYFIPGESFTIDWINTSVQESSANIANDIKWDERLNAVFITGTFSNSLTFNSSNINTSAITDAYFGWLNPNNGTVVFNNLHGLGSDPGAIAEGTCLASDDNNHVYFGGTIWGNVNTAFPTFLGGASGFNSASLTNSSYVFSWQINSVSLDFAEILNSGTSVNITGMDANNDRLSFVGFYGVGTVQISSVTTDAQINLNPFNNNYIFMGQTEIGSLWSAHNIVNSTQHIASNDNHFPTRISTGEEFTYTTGAYRGNLDYFIGTPSSGPLVASGNVSGIHNAFILRLDPFSNQFRTPELIDENTELNITESLTVSAYPNPTNGLTTVSIEGFDFEKTAQLEVFNLQGQKVFTQTLNQAQSQIDLSQFEEGAYLIKVQLGDHMELIRVVKS